MAKQLSKGRLLAVIEIHKEGTMLKRILRACAILPVLVLLFMFSASPAQAADVRSGDAVIISSGDEINDDLYIAASRITINGTVNGDVVCAGETIEINGVIKGSVIALGSTISIAGEVTNSVRVAGANIDISGKIGRDVLVAGDSVNLVGSSAISRDLFFAARGITVDNFVERNIRGWGDEVAINDAVAGDIEVGATQLTIASTARIQGNLIYVSDNEAIIRTGAQIGGTTTHNLPKERESNFNWGLWNRVMAFLMTLAVGCLLILVAPKKAIAAAEAIKTKPLASLGWGALILFVAPIAILITLVTVIGIPLGLIGILIYGLAIYLAQIAVGLFIGYLIIGYFGKAGSRGVLVGAFALGFSLLTLLKLIPYIGFFLWLATVIFGIGAMALALKKGRTDVTEPAVEVSTLAK
jgi:cytoskeletal protein CcmA (bactofilin family)